MDLLRSCSSISKDDVPAASIAEAVASSGSDLDQSLICRIALSLYRAGLDDPQRLADAAAFLSTSKLFGGGFF